MTFDEFKKGYALLLEAFPNKEMSPALMLAGLQDLTFADYMKAVADLITTQQEIYPNTNMIALIRARAIQKIDTIGGEAWANVLSAVSSVGSYGSPVFDDYITQKAVECIGWKTICMSECIGVERAHFLKVFEQLKERANEDAVRPKGIENLARQISSNMTPKIGHDNG